MGGQLGKGRTAAKLIDRIAEFSSEPEDDFAWLEALGFCGRGEGGAFVEDGRLRVGGALPTNTDGGGLSACHPGMRGMFLMVEAVRQLRKEAVGRQVPDAKVACVNATGGWFSSSGTMLLGTE